MPGGAAVTSPGLTLAELLGLPAGGCQRWRRRRHSWRRRSDGGFDARRYRVVPLPEVPAREFVQRHHYSRSWPSAKLRYGLVEDGRWLVGVCVLGISMREAVLTNPLPTLRAYDESMELSRLVLLDEVAANGESWFVARAFAAAAEQGVRGVVAFSDPVPRQVRGQVLSPGHVGAVYQALNAVYTGRGTARTLTILPDGTVLSDRSAQKVRAGERGAAGTVRRLVELGAPAPDRGPCSGWLADALAAVGARTLRHPGNHRYVWTLGPARACIPVGFAARAYPKRHEQVGGRPHLRTAP